MKEKDKDKTNTIAESLLPKAILENLSEDSFKKIEEKLNNIVESKVAERVDAAVAAAEANFDAEANKDLDKLVTTIEEAHKRMAYKAMMTLKENYNNKLKKVRSYYTGKVQKDADRFTGKLVECVNNFVEARIDKVMPYSELKQALRNNTAMKVLESMKNVLGVSSAAECAKSYLKEPIMEAKQKLIAYNKQCKKLDESNKQLQAKLNESNKQLYLEKKLKGLDEDSAAFMRRTMKNASIDFIKENFDFALDRHKEKMAEEKENLKQRALSNPARKQVKSVSRSILVENTAPANNNRDYNGGINGLIKDVLESID